MNIVIEILFIIIVPTAVTLAGWSIFTIHKAGRQPCNGELKQLAHLDTTIKKFNNIVRQSQRPHAVMRHTKTT